MFNDKLFTKKLRSVSYILVADDDLDDQELIRDALVENNVDENKIQFVDDGMQLLESLDKNKILPSLILLDLNMPRKGGKEALVELKKSELYRHIPIIIFTTSDSEIDIKQCYSLGTNAFMTKPSSYYDLVDSMKMLTQYWLVKARIVLD